MRKALVFSLSALVIWLCARWMFGEDTPFHDEWLDVSVDYEKSIAQYTQDARYAAVHPNLTDKEFPPEGRGQIKLTILLVHFDRQMSVREVVRGLADRGLRPASVRELLSLGLQYPNKQREFPILALGSAYSEHSPFLWITSDEGRIAWLAPSKNATEYADFVRYIAVKKSDE